jgi:polysaccharide pyruvyl transferase WcaK-like protein
MHILIDPGCYHCGNVGDLAMLQVAIERLRGLWAQASIHVVTSVPDALRLHCPGVSPVPEAGRNAFVSDRFLGRADRLLPRQVSDTLALAEQHMRHRWPAVLASLIGSKRALARRPDSAAPRAYVDALDHADLVLVTGAGIFTDAFLDNAMGVMATLELAIERKIVTAVMGQGFGPVVDAALRQRMAQVLPRVDLIALREEREGVRLLESIGVSRDRICITGDDAIEMAHRRTPAAPGQGIGINIRLASFAGVNGSAIDAIRPVLQGAASRFGAPLVPIPTAHHSGRSDVDAIEQLIAGHSDAPVAVVGGERPVNVIAEVSRCRIMVTGSYHGAVFALAQGIPVVAMVGSRYYLDKFSGLAEMFGQGCELVEVGAPDAGGVLERAIDRAWSHAPRWRESLLRAADRQIAWGKSAYWRLGRIAGAGASARRARVTTVRTRVTGRA